MSAERLAEIATRHDAATRGPWRWTGNTTGSGNLHLWALDRWRHIVMGFQRWGMRSAQPTFRVDDIMVKAQELHVCPDDHNPWRVTGLNHPDAIAIERSWEDIDYLLIEVERLQRERDRLKVLFAWSRGVFPVEPYTQAMGFWKDGKESIEGFLAWVDVVAEEGRALVEAGRAEDDSAE